MSTKDEDFHIMDATKGEIQYTGPKYFTARIVYESGWSEIRRIVPGDVIPIDAKVTEVPEPTYPCFNAPLGCRGRVGLLDALCTFGCDCGHQGGRSKLRPAPKAVTYGVEDIKGGVEATLDLQTGETTSRRITPEEFVEAAVAANEMARNHEGGPPEDHSAPSVTDEDRRKAKEALGELGEVTKAVEAVATLLATERQRDYDEAFEAGMAAQRRSDGDPS